MLERMSMLLLCPGMAKHVKDPNDVIRFPAALTVADRARLRIVAAHLGQAMEDVAGAWLVDRLAAEEKRLGIQSPGRTRK